MIVLDTHAWIWWAASPERLSETARRALGEGEPLGVCTISVFELGTLAARRRITLDRDVRAWARQALDPAVVETLPLTDGIAVDAALLERERFPKDPADRIIYATARALGSRLVTRDDAIRSFDPARTVW